MENNREVDPAMVECSGKLPCPKETGLRGERGWDMQATGEGHSSQATACFASLVTARRLVQNVLGGFTAPPFPLESEPQNKKQ